MGDAASVFKDMDELLNQFCAAHEIPFSRAFKMYLKGHSVKAPGENPWNTYTKLHTHQDHKERELARVGYTIEGFQLLDSEEQQKLRARCWKEFQQSFDSPTECNASLDIFRQFSACDDKEKGISIARRRKLFDGLLNKLAKMADVAALEHKFNYYILCSGNQVHADQSLVDIRMSPGMYGFTEAFCKADATDMKGHMLTWCFGNKAKVIVSNKWDKDPANTPAPFNAPSPPSLLSPSPSLICPSPSPIPPSPSQTALRSDTVGVKADTGKAKLATEVRQVLRALILEGGGALGDSLSAPWKRLGGSCAQWGLQMLNWNPECRYPPETKGGKGIESAHTQELRALLAQAADKTLPLSVQRVDNPAHQQALLDSTRPVITTIPFGKPLKQRLLFANNVVAEEFIHTTRTPKTVKLQDPLPSSKLTPIEDSSDFSPPPVPQSTKGGSKRKVGEGSEAEGRSKCQKAPLSDSSSVKITVGKIVEPALVNLRRQLTDGLSDSTHDGPIRPAPRALDSPPPPPPPSVASRQSSPLPPPPPSLVSRQSVASSPRARSVASS
ncbi:hypothetical protein FIBSPDRAFT_901961, partial [Athelia psychrophila]